MSSRSTLIVSGTALPSQSYNASWTGSGNLFIGGNATASFGSSRFTGSMMEFRLWSEALEEDKFDNHVSNPKSYLGNTPSSSYYNLVRRFSFDDNKVLPTNAEIRDTSSDRTLTITGSAIGFAGANTFETLVDKTKTIVPNFGPGRRNSNKIRLESNFLSGSGASLSIGQRYDFSSTDTNPIDEPKLGIYFSPTDTINEDIVNSFADLDYNQLIGDPRDIFSEDYKHLTRAADQYFQKYGGNNNFFDYIRLIKYYDQNIFKQIRKLIPARAKEVLGTVIENNILERPKSPVQRNNPSFEELDFDETINISNFEAEHEDSSSVLTTVGEYPNYVGTSRLGADIFAQPSLYKFSKNDSYDETLRYISGSAVVGGPDRVFQEVTGSIITQNRLSLNNKEYRYFYTSSEEYEASNIYSTDRLFNIYESRSLVQSDVDPFYDDSTALNATFYEGVKNTPETTIDNDSPVVITQTAPSVAVPADLATSDLNVFDENENRGYSRGDAQQDRRREAARRRRQERRQQNNRNTFDSAEDGEELDFE